MKIGNNIRQIRSAQMIETSFMAQQLNMSVVEYEAIENDESDITLSVFETIANLLSIEAADLMSLEKPSKGVRNFFFNHSGFSGTNIHSQGVDEEKIRKLYRDLYAEEINRIPKFIKLLREHNIPFDF